MGQVVTNFLSHDKCNFVFVAGVGYHWQRKHEKRLAFFVAGLESVAFFGLCVDPDQDITIKRLAILRNLAAEVFRYRFNAAHHPVELVDSLL